MDVSRVGNDGKLFDERQIERSKGLKRYSVNLELLPCLAKESALLQAACGAVQTLK